MNDANHEPEVDSRIQSLAPAAILICVMFFVVTLILGLAAISLMMESGVNAASWFTLRVAWIPFGGIIWGSWLKRKLFGHREPFLFWMSVVVITASLAFNIFG